MPSKQPERISVKTALFIANAFGPATATHYLLRHQLHQDTLKDPLPEEFFTLLAKLNAAEEERQLQANDKGADSNRPELDKPDA